MQKTIKLIKSSEHQGLSWCVVDIVFYKDDKGKEYRLQYVIPKDISKLKEEENWLRVTCVSSYAPDIIEGEIIKEFINDIHVSYEDNIYIIQKNAENFKFLDLAGIKQR